MDASPLDRLRAALAGRYALERELGRGGMATVCLARDLKHDRLVALKVLRPELAAALGPERFLREITVTAGLHHPHILPLLDSGDAEGQLFYVMPYVEGETLRDRLRREHQLPLEDALQITREVADALGHAHSRGVVHRDVKPENILLESGHAVVADFGIAKALTAAGGARLTETGIAVGTPAYMSPEQAAGSSEVDGRSDLYSLGCVLYEMLSGETPYTGPTPQAILAKKLSEPLPRISVVRETVPAPVEAALTKALARAPADRWVTAAEFAAALAHPEMVATPSAGTRLARRRALAVVRRLPRWGKLSAAVAVVAVIALVAGLLFRPRPLNVTVSDVTPVTSDPGVEFEPAISPDGQEVAYVAGPIDQPRLYVRSTANVEGEAAIRLGDTARGTEFLPIWNPDGQSIRFLECGPLGVYALYQQGSPECAYQEVGKLGGAVRPVAVQRGDRWTWSPDGTRVAFARRGQIYISSATDTAARPIIPAKYITSPLDIHSLSWSPDGRWIAFIIGNSAWRTGTNVAVSVPVIVPAAGGEPWQLAESAALRASPVWLDARHLLWISSAAGSRVVYAIEIGARGPRGEQRAIPGIPDPHSISYSPASRRLAFSRFTYRQNIWAYPLNPVAPVSIRAGRAVTTGTQVIETHDVSPDGKLVVYEGGQRGMMDLYKVPAAGGEAVTLASIPGGVASSPRWSLDGREIAFYGSNGISVVPADGGTLTALTEATGVNTAPAWSPSGLDVSFFSTRTGTRATWIVSRDSIGGAWHEARLLVDSSQGIADWAPDGSGALVPGRMGGPHSTWTFVSRQGRILWRRDLAAMYGLTLFAGGARFSRDGRTIYAGGAHQDGRRGVWAFPAGGGTPRLVVAFDDPALDGPFGYLSVGPDRLYLTVAEYESDIWVAKLRW